MVAPVRIHGRRMLAWAACGGRAGCRTSSCPAASPPAKMTASAWDARDSAAAKALLWRGVGAGGQGWEGGWEWVVGRRAVWAWRVSVGQSEWERERVRASGPVLGGWLGR
jgi:hypothetical protein